MCGSFLRTSAHINSHGVEHNMFVASTCTITEGLNFQFLEALIHVDIQMLKTCWPTLAPVIDMVKLRALDVESER